jgi:hypothetical protein
MAQTELGAEVEAGGRRKMVPAEAPHLAAPFLDAGFAPRLDYHALGGPGLERLCYLLLLADGHLPRFFGRSGQQQGGVDLLVFDGSRHLVYQCKNLKRWDRQELGSALAELAAGWLAGGPEARPEAFVICCPLDWRDARQELEWDGLVEKFHGETGVPVRLWHKTYLDERLRKLPDIVADLFSAAAAEDFCDCPDWDEDLFRPVGPHAGSQGSIGIYLELKKRGALVLGEKLAADFSAILPDQPQAFLLGPAGSGKTMAALALSEALGDGAWRVFFVDFRHGFSEEGLVRGIKRRSARPTLFVFDECQDALPKAARVLDRVAGLSRREHLRLVLTVKTLAREPGHPQEEEDPLLLEAEAQGQVVRLQPNLEQYREILEQHQIALPKSGLQQLFARTAGDLKLLDLALVASGGGKNLEEIDLARIFDQALRRYFGGSAAPHREELRRAAAVAQLDLDLPVEDYGPASRGPLPKGLVAIGGQPPRLEFVHTSAAELVFRALCHSGHKDWREEATAALRGHLLRLAQALRPGWELQLSSFLRHRLRLEDDEPLKTAVLLAPELVERFRELRPALPLDWVARAAIVCRARPDSPYRAWARDQLAELAESPDPAASSKLAGTSVSRLWWAAIHGGIPREELERLIPAPRLARLLLAAGTLVDLIHLLPDLSEGHALGLLRALDRKQIEHLLEQTRKRKAPIGMLNLALRELARRPDPEAPGSYLLDRLEAAIDGDFYWRLLDARGNLSHLFRCLHHSTPRLAAQIIAGLDGPRVERLLERTIEQGSSVGTVSYALHELAEREDPERPGRSLASRLEPVLGADFYARLLDARGDLTDLFRWLQHFSPSLAANTIALLDAPRAERLTLRAIERGRSIGTLGLSLRELAENSDHENPGGSILKRLESALGAASFLRLLAALGSLRDLLHLLENSSPAFAARLIAGLDEKLVDLLVGRTLEKKQSIGTLSLSLRQLARRPEREAENQALFFESRLSPRQWLRLISGVGDFGALSWLAQDLSPAAWRAIFALPEAAEAAFWRNLGRRGDFFDLCQVASGGLPKTPQAVRRALLEALRELAGEALGRSGWRAITSGAVRLEAGRDRELCQLLGEALEQHLRTVEIGGLPLADPVPAAAALRLVLAVRPELRPRLAELFRQIWPPARPPEEHPLAVGRQVLELARQAGLEGEEKRRLLEHYSILRPALQPDEVHDGPLAIFLWHRFAFWLEEVRPAAAGFEAPCPPADLDLLQRRLAGRAERTLRTPQERLGFLLLAGALAFLAPGRRKALSAVARRQLRLAGLPEAVEPLGLVSGFLAAEGLALICPVEVAFGQDRCGKLAALAGRLPLRGRSTDLICRTLERRRQGRLHKSWANGEPIYAPARPGRPPGKEPRGDSGPGRRDFS